MYSSNFSSNFSSNRLPGWTLYLYRAASRPWRSLCGLISQIEDRYHLGLITRTCGDDETTQNFNIAAGTQMVWRRAADAKKLPSTSEAPLSIKLRIRESITPFAINPWDLIACNVGSWLLLNSSLHLNRRWDVTGTLRKTDKWNNTTVILEKQ